MCPFFVSFTHHQVVIWKEHLAIVTKKSRCSTYPYGQGDALSLISQGCGSIASEIKNNFMFSFLHIFYTFSSYPLGL